MNEGASADSTLGLAGSLSSDLLGSPNGNLSGNLAGSPSGSLGWSPSGSLAVDPGADPAATAPGARYSWWAWALAPRIT